MTNGGPRHPAGKKRVGGPKPAPKNPKPGLKRRTLIPSGLASVKSR